MPQLSPTEEILKKLILFATISSDSNLEMIAFMADILKKNGAYVEILHDETGKKANLWATIGPDIDGGIVLSGHSDVVPVAQQVWSSDPFEMRAHEGKLYGRGTCDMKGFLAACLAVAPKYAALDLKRPVHFAFTYDEETGCIGAAHLVEAIRESGKQPAMAIIGEPTEMRVIEGHKAVCEYTATFKGLEGHGSAPDAGVNAAEYAVRYVSKLMELREALKARAPKWSEFEPPWTTINIGKIEGGMAHNVIVGHAEVEWEMRPVQHSDGDFVKGEMQNYIDNVLLPAMKSVHPSASITVETVGEVVGLEPMEENEAKRVVMKLTGANQADLVAFGTEAGLFQSIGMSAVLCGPGSISQAHKPDEFIARDQLAACDQMLEKLAEYLV